MRKLGVEILKKNGYYEINGVGLSGFSHKNNLNLDYAKNILHNCQ